MKTNKTQPTIFFTADTHFGHANIIRFVNRPFEDADAMDEALIANWNATVGPDDHVYHLGDVALSNGEYCQRILDQLNGKIFLIAGNHEKAAQRCADRFEWIKDYFELKIEDSEAKGGRQLIVLCHYAMREWNASHHGSWQLYGHSHGTLPDDPTMQAFDVGVDCHDYRPISYAEVKAIMAKKTWKPPF